MLRGQSVANGVGGFLEATDGKTDAVLAGVAEGVKRLAASVVDRNQGSEPNSNSSPMADAVAADAAPAAIGAAE